MQYDFSLHDPRIIFNNSTQIKLNAKLQLLSEPELFFIPTFLIENRKSDFIPYERAFSIARSNQMREVSKPLTHGIPTFPRLHNHGGYWINEFSLFEMR